MARRINLSVNKLNCFLHNFNLWIGPILEILEYQFNLLTVEFISKKLKIIAILVSSEYMS